MLEKPLWMQYHMKGISKPAARNIFYSNTTNKEFQIICADAKIKLFINALKNFFRYALFS